jgi:hypothetical protein
MQKFIVELLQLTWKTSWKVIKIIIPVSILVKILDLLGVITKIGEYLGPAMEFIGLPNSFGLVWATTMFANIYGGIYVFLNYGGSQTYTIAQVSILATMMLIAHSLPMELEVANSVGIKRWFMFAIRFLSAYIGGFILSKIMGNWLHETNHAIFPQQLPDPTFIWYKWVIDQLKNYTMLILIIFGILLLMKLLEQFGLIKYLQNGLKPLLSILGINQIMIPLVLLGMLLGIVYGGALIIKEAEENPDTPKQDLINSMILLGLCHAIVEDTLLLMGLGANLIIILFYRLIFGFLVTYLFVYFTNGKTKFIKMITN